MITQCITAAVLFGAGDIVAQQAIEGKGKEHDVSRCFIPPFCPPIVVKKVNRYFQLVCTHHTTDILRR